MEYVSVLEHMLLIISILIFSQFFFLISTNLSLYFVVPVARVSFVVVDWINGNGSGETYTFLNDHNGFIDK